MSQNEDIETGSAKRRWPLWVGVLAFVGVAAVLARIFCRGGSCKGEACCKPSKAA